MKIWYKSDKNKEYNNYEIILNFRNNNSRNKYANEWVDNVIASQFSLYFIHRNHENPIFHLIFFFFNLPYIHSE